MPGFTRGSHKAKAIMKRRDVQRQSGVRDGENKENKIEERNKNYKTSPPTVPYGKQSNAQTDDNVKIFLMPGLSLLQKKKNRNIFCHFILSMNLFSTVS